MLQWQDTDRGVPRTSAVEEGGKGSRVRKQLRDGNGPMRRMCLFDYMVSSTLLGYICAYKDILHLLLIMLITSVGLLSAQGYASPK